MRKSANTPAVESTPKAATKRCALMGVLLKMFYQEVSSLELYSSFLTRLTRGKVKSLKANIDLT